MIADERFNKRAAKLVHCVPIVKTGPGYAEGVCLELASNHESPGAGDLRIHMTPDEAVALGISLIQRVTKGRL